MYRFWIILLLIGLYCFNITEHMEGCQTTVDINKLKEDNKEINKKIALLENNLNSNTTHISTIQNQINEVDNQLNKMKS